jgi:hypothetical protein
MALSYSMMIVVEGLLLVSIFTAFLVLGRNRLSTKSFLFSSSPDSRRKATSIAFFLMVGAASLFLVPKISLLTQYDGYTKLTTDSWDHFLVIDSWNATSGRFDTKVYPYYANFPVTYSAQLMLHHVAGLELFQSMTLYYFAVGIAGLFIVFGIGREIIAGSRNEKLIFGGIAGVIYSFLQYLNLLFVQQYPIALGTVAGLLSVYSMILLIKGKRKSIIYLCVASIILVISHSTGPIFLSILFGVYFLTRLFMSNKGSATNPLRNLMSKRAALFMCLTVIVAGWTYSSFVASGSFESGIRWSELNTKYTFMKLTSELFESTTSGVGQSFEGRYNLVDTLVYPMNWALPVSTSISILIFSLIKRGRIAEDRELRILFPLAIVSTIVFVFTFAFSFVEFAFSRYFGAFALAFNIPVTSLLVFRIVKSRIVIMRYITFAIFAFAIFASVTDPTMLPFISDGNTIYRNAEFYPATFDLLAWNDFYSMIGSDQKLIWTNLDTAPIRYYQEANHYSNEIVMNPRNFTLTSENAYLIIDKEKADLATDLQSNPLLDKVYDNSRVYVGN